MKKRKAGRSFLFFALRFSVEKHRQKFYFCYYFIKSCSNTGQGLYLIYRGKIGLVVSLITGLLISIVLNFKKIMVEC